MAGMKLETTDCWSSTQLVQDALQLDISPKYKYSAG